MFTALLCDVYVGALLVLISLMLYFCRYLAMYVYRLFK